MLKTLKYNYRVNTESKVGRRLRGQDSLGTLFEWYGESGGQLKYYPLAENVQWKSKIFHLEPLPIDWAKKHGILAKAKDYFSDVWESLQLDQ